MIIDVEKLNDCLKISYINKQGKIDFKYYNGKLYNWQVTFDKDNKKNKIYKNWDGKPVKQKNTPYPNKFSVIEILESMSEEDKSDMFNFTNPQMSFLDIEVEVTDSFPDPKYANNKITAISLVMPNREIHIFALKPINTQELISIENDVNNYISKFNIKYSLNYHYYITEYDMLYTLLTEYIKKLPLISGWNFILFDWEYIINRSRRLGIDPTICSISKQFQYNTNLPLHKILIDYLEIYKKWDKSIAVKENYTLDTTAESILGIKKVKYPGTLQQLYESDYLKYIFYNVIDTILVELIHEHIKTMEIVVALSDVCHISVYKASSPVTITETLLIRKFLEYNIIVCMEEKTNTKSEKFEGAFVKNPIVGKHKAVACFDFASLYPSIMRQFNISPESLVEKVMSKYIETSRNDDNIVTVTGTVFDKKESIMKKILDYLYTQRKIEKMEMFKWKMKVQEIEYEIHELEKLL